MTQRLVLPLDMSETAEAAVPIAKGLAQQLDLPVTLVFVLDVPSRFGSYVRQPERAERTAPSIPKDAPVSTASPYGRWTGWSSNEPSERQLDRLANDTAECERYLRRIAEQFEGITTEVTVQYGSPADAILHTAERRNDSPVVIASHGRSGFGRAFLGSVATRVVQSASAPVFVVRGRQPAAVGGEYRVRKMLAAVDGSGSAEFALKTALDMFGGPEGEVHLLHVMQDPIFGERADAGAYLRWLIAQCGVDTGSITSEVVEGRAAAEINRVAGERNVDLVVLGSHGYSGIDRFVLGSVAERVLRDAEQPLMVVHAPTTD